MVRPLIQFGIERDDPPIGILKLLIECFELLLPGLEQIHLYEDLLVLLADFLHGVRGSIRRQFFCDRFECC